MSNWEEWEKRGKEMFYSGKTLADVIIASNDNNRAALLTGYDEAKKSFQSRNFELEIEEQRVHFKGVESSVK
jgi:hypothetical protein